MIPFFDYDPDVFYPLLDDERFVDVLETLLGENFILTVSEGVIHAGAVNGIMTPVPPRASSV